MGEDNNNKNVAEAVESKFRFYLEIVAERKVSVGVFPLSQEYWVLCFKFKYTFILYDML